MRHIRTPMGSAQLPLSPSTAADEHCPSTETHSPHGPCTFLPGLGPLRPCQLIPCHCPCCTRSSPTSPPCAGQIIPSRPPIAAVPTGPDAVQKVAADGTAVAMEAQRILIARRRSAARLSPVPPSPRQHPARCGSPPEQPLAASPPPPVPAAALERGRGCRPPFIPICRRVPGPGGGGGRAAGTDPRPQQRVQCAACPPRDGARR